MKRVRFRRRFLIVPLLAGCLVFVLGIVLLRSSQTASPAPSPEEIQVRKKAYLLFKSSERSAERARQYAEANTAPGDHNLIDGSTTSTSALSGIFAKRQQEQAVKLRQRQEEEIEEAGAALHDAEYFDERIAPLTRGP